MREEQKVEIFKGVFISHLSELRIRIVKALIGVIIVFLCLMPWAAHIYDLLAEPMLATLPEGSKMIATGVTTPFLIPVKLTLMSAFSISTLDFVPILGIYCTRTVYL